MLKPPFRANEEGEFFFRVRPHGKSDDREPVRIALLVDGKEVKTVEDTAPQKMPRVYENPAPPVRFRRAGP